MKYRVHLVVVLLASGLLLGASKAPPRIDPIEESRFLVKFTSREYDRETDRTRFRYRVNPEGRTGTIRFVIGYGACGDVQIRLDPETPERVIDVRVDHLDDETGIYGLEWTSRLRRWGGTPFWFEIQGDIPLGNVRIAVQEDGDNWVAGLLPGPNCAPLMVDGADEPR